MKKILLSIGTISMTALPIVSVVACGNDGEETTSKFVATVDGVEYTFEINDKEQVVGVSVKSDTEVSSQKVEQDIKFIAQNFSQFRGDAPDAIMHAIDDIANEFNPGIVRNNSGVETQVKGEQPDTGNQVITPTPTSTEQTPVDMDFDHSIYNVKSVTTRNNWDTLDSGMRGYLVSNNKDASGNLLNTMPNLSATVYETEYINFAFDDDLNYPEEVAKDLIKKFFEQTTWGFGLLSMDTILITNKQMGSAGWGGAAKDLMVSSNVYNNTNIDQNESNMQMMFDTLRHEYGHHETMVSDSLVGGQFERTKNLIDNKMPNYQVLSTVQSGNQTNIDALKTTMMTNTNPTQADKQINEIYTAPIFADIPYGYYVSKDFSYNLSYHYGPSEVLNRTMNVLEASAITAPKYISGSPIINADNMGYYFSDAQHSQKLLDPTTGLYDQANTNKVIDLWKNYVYGYGKNKLSVDYFNISGYTDVDVDFAVVKKGTSTGLIDQTVKLEKAPTHFISSRTSFGTAPTWDTSYMGYSGVIQPIGTYYPMSADQKNDPLNQPKFYKDSNNNGQLDSSDALVTNINFDFNV